MVICGEVTVTGSLRPVDDVAHARATGHEGEPVTQHISVKVVLLKADDCVHEHSHHGGVYTVGSETRDVWEDAVEERWSVERLHAKRIENGVGLHRAHVGQHLAVLVLHVTV